MAQYLVQGDTLSNIANAIREKTGSSDPMMVNVMAEAIANISGSIELDGLKVYSGTLVPASDDQTLILTRYGDSLHEELFNILDNNNWLYATCFLMDEYDTTGHETLYVTKNRHYVNGNTYYALSRARVQNNVITIDTSTEYNGGNKLNFSSYVGGISENNYTFAKSNYLFKAGKTYGWFILGVAS